MESGQSTASSPFSSSRKLKMCLGCKAFGRQKLKTLDFLIISIDITYTERGKNFSNLMNPPGQADGGDRKFFVSENIKYTSSLSLKT